MIQDIFPHKLDNHFYPARKPDANSYVMAFRHQDILVKGEEFPRASSFSDDCREKLIYLFAVDEDYYFFLDARDETMALPEDYEFVNVRSFRRSGIAEKTNVFLAFTALQLANWYRGNKYCGICGKETHIDDKERALRCDCGNVIYPRIVPAVIVGITNGDKILVTKYKTGFAHFALVAGFTEIGETLRSGTSATTSRSRGGSSTISWWVSIAMLTVTIRSIWTRASSRSPSGGPEKISSSSPTITALRTR